MHINEQSFRGSFGLLYAILKEAKQMPWWKQVWLSYRASRLHSFHAQKVFLLAAIQGHEARENVKQP